MKKTYVTTMPNHIGSFLKASRLFASLGVNITRVSYNKAVDSHTLFIDAEGTREQLERAESELREIGYLRNITDEKSVVLLEFRLRDVPGSVTDVLELIDEFEFNISYISSQENGTDFQMFKMGLFVDGSEKIAEFMSRAEELCDVRVIDYNPAEKVFDNSIFYNSFVSSLAEGMNLSQDDRNELLVNANLAMQMLDEKGLSPFRTFDSIGKFANLLSVCRGAAFNPRISRHELTENTYLLLIEPPCGSNTAIIRNGGKALFVDSGYACYREEMLAILRRLMPDYDELDKVLFLTHADVDHCGLASEFDKIYASEKTRECLSLEYEGRDGFREKNPLHKPYVRTCRILTSHKAINPQKIITPWKSEDGQKSLLRQTGNFEFGDLSFEVYEGKGGHLPGETVLIDYVHRIAFTGDIYVNIKGMTPEQAKYNTYAPILMTSVDTDPKLCAEERRAILQRLGAGSWKVFGSHGGVKEYNINIEE